MDFRQDKESLMEPQTPKVGDRVAIPKHAVIFIVQSVNEAMKTVDAAMVTEKEHIEKNIPWKMLTIIDP
jgi:hypothetical protein